eukprot:6412929-Prorocentrum_lima.AAC.1
MAEMGTGSATYLVALAVANSSCTLSRAKTLLAAILRVGTMALVNAEQESSRRVARQPIQQHLEERGDHPVTPGRRCPGTRGGMPPRQLTEAWQWDSA